MWRIYSELFIILLSLTLVAASFSDYVSSIGNYFGYNQQAEESNELFSQKIPYEVSTTDEKFLTEAAKLTGVALSELDSCQQRVVLKLKSDCNKMNDEQLAKMAVHLLNCQSFVEGRQIYVCTDEMSIRDCTTSMDSDTWTSYHLMSNRARAVCYSIRQNQFRGLAEHTVNRLMDAARGQLKTLGQIASNQEDLRHMAETTYDTLSKGHENLAKQQKDIESAQFQGQLVIEDNIKRLVDEKRLILETHNEMIQMTSNIHDSLGHSLKQLSEQSHESRLNHKKLTEDLLQIQKKTQDIFKKIDESSLMLLKQNEDFKNQYESTLRNLEEVNKTVHSLVTLMGGTRQVLEERLTWINNALGGTDLAVERLYLILWHIAFMLLAMLACAFLSARASTRLAIATLPPLNLAVALSGEHQYLDPVSLAGAIGIFVLVQTVLTTLLSLKPTVRLAIPWVKEQMTLSKSNASSNSPNGHVSSSFTSPRVPTSLTNVLKRNQYDHFNFEDENLENESTDYFREDLTPLTPPISRNGHYSVNNRSRSRSNTPLHINTSLKGPCKAKTRLGTPCKLSSLPGRDYCYRHQTGDSVMG